jgi:hypothetical protein
MLACSGKSDRKTNQTVTEIQNPKEDSVSSNSSRKTMGASLHVSICFLVLLSLFAIRADAQHVHQLLYNNYDWSDQNLMGEPTFQKNEPDVPTGIAAFTTTPNNQVHVYYVGADGNRRETDCSVFFNGTNWSDENLSQETGGPPTQPGYWAGLSIANEQYLFYVDVDNDDLHELYYNNIGWTDVDLSMQIGAPKPAGAWGITGFVVPGTQTMEVFYTDSTYHMYQISSSDNLFWSQQDLTALTNGPSAEPGDPFTAFATTPNNQLHVYYVSQTRHVNQLFFNGSSWSNGDLTSQTHAGNVIDNAGMSGFSLGNYQYVYYPAN